MPSLSILIVNWNTREMLRSCLQSLLDHPYDGGQEVIVVDNASSDGSAEMVRNDFPGTILVASETNTGYAEGNNLAFERAGGEYQLTLNPDAEVREGTLNTAIRKLEENPTYGVLGAKQIGPDGEIQDSIRGFPTATGIFGELTGLSRARGKLGHYRQRDFDYKKEQPADQPMGTFLLFRRQALESIGDPKRPFDAENFPIFFNEVDLLYRLKKAGWPTLYSPEVEVLHHGGASTKQVRKSMIWESHNSLMRYFRKHHRSPFLWLMNIAVWLGAFVRAKGYDKGFKG